MSLVRLPVFVFTETWSIRQPNRREGLVRGPSVTGASSKETLVLQLPHPMLHLRCDGFVPYMLLPQHVTPCHSHGT